MSHPIYDMTNANSISTINNRQTLSLNRQVDPDMISNNEILFYQVLVEDIWGQKSYSNIESGSNHEKFIFSRVVQIMILFFRSILMKITDYTQPQE